MEIIDFNSLEGYVKACNGKTLDALVLIYILQEGFEVSEKHYFLVAGEYIKMDIGVTTAQLTGILKRLESRFGIEKRMMRHPDFSAPQMHFAINKDEIFAIMELYMNL